MNKFTFSIICILVITLLGSYLAITIFGTDIIFLLAIILIVMGGAIFYASLKKQVKNYHIKNIQGYEDRLKKLDEDFQKGLIGKLQYNQEREILEVQIDIQKRNKEW